MQVEIVKALGRRMKWLTMLLIVITPILLIGLFMTQGPFALANIPREVEIFPEMLNWVRVIIVVLLSLLTTVTYVFGYFYMYKLFDLYSKGIVFDKINILLIHKAGVVLIVIDIVSLLQKLISGPVFSYLGVTSNYVSIEIKISMLVVGVFIVLISKVMTIARDLFERDQLTI